jgi:hypothetical protein
MDDETLLLWFDSRYHEDAVLVDKLSRRALPHYIVDAWIDFARKQIKTLNLSVTPVVSNRNFGYMIAMGRRIEDTIRHYDAAWNMLALTECRDANCEIIKHAHEYIQDNGDLYGRTAEINMFTHLATLDKESRHHHFA